jgi:hypothetical protein
MLHFFQKTKLKEFKKDIRFWFSHKIEFPIKSFFTGISNLWKWKSVIWHDRDFDYVFLLIILKFKIDKMIELYNYRDIYVDQEKDKQELKLCSKFLDRLIKNDYQKNAMIYHDREWGEISFIWKKCEDSENYKLETDRKNIISEKDKEKEREKFMKLMKHSNYMENQDIEYLFDIMKKKLRSWWI